MTTIRTKHHADPVGSTATKPQRPHASQECAKHGAELAAHREAERISEAIESLHTIGKIGEAEQRAADRWLQSYHVGLVGIRRQDGSGIRGNPSFDGFNAGRLDALASYKAANIALGRPGTAILFATQVDQLSMRGLAQKLGRDHAFWAGVVAVTLSRLADHYALMDRHQRPERIHDCR